MWENKRQSMKNNELRDECRINIFTRQLQSKILQFDGIGHWCILQGYVKYVYCKKCLVVIVLYLTKTMKQNVSQGSS